MGGDGALQTGILLYSYRAVIKPFIHPCKHIYIHKCMHIYIHRYMHANIHSTRMHVCIHPYLHTYIYTYDRKRVQMISHWGNVLVPLGSVDYPGSMMLEPLQFCHCVFLYA